MRCRAVRDGKAPMKWLAPCFDCILRTDLTGEKALFYLSLSLCFGTEYFEKGCSREA